MTKKKHKKKPKQTGKSVWRDAMAIPAAVLAYRGCNNSEIQRYLKISDNTFAKWQKNKPLLVQAIREGRTMRTEGKADNLQDWVVSRLSKPAREVWDSIMFWQEHVDAHDKLRAISSTISYQMRQRLWLYAFLRSNFSISAACKTVGISRHTILNWKKDAGFKELMAEIEEMQGDFIEEALMDLVASRDTGAVIFASRTKNRNRGYGDKLEIDNKHSGSVNVQHTFHVDRLIGMLSVNARAEISEAMTKLREQEEKAVKAKQLADRGVSENPIEVRATTIDSDED